MTKQTSETTRAPQKLEASKRMSLPALYILSMSFNVIQIFIIGSTLPKSSKCYQGHTHTKSLNQFQCPTPARADRGKYCPAWVGRNEFWSRGAVTERGDRGQQWIQRSKRSVTEDVIDPSILPNRFSSLELVSFWWFDSTSA